MDETQEYLDGLFETPVTVNGCRNKLRFIRRNIVNLPFKSKRFKLSQIITKETVDLLHDLDRLAARQRIKNLNNGREIV